MMSLDVTRIKHWAQSFLPGLLEHGLDKRIPALVTLAAIILLTQSLANLTWTLVPTPELTSEAPSVSSRARPNRVIRRQRPERLADKIAQWHLFGDVAKVPVAPPPVPKKDIKVPDTPLNLKLRGVFASTIPENARAIIADAKGKEESYKIGDDIIGKAILREVYNDRVILERNGRLETLKLPVDVGGHAGVETAAVKGLPPPPVPLTPRNNALNPANSAETARLLRGYRDALINDPQSVMGLLRAEPFRKDGKLHGFRIRPGKDRQLLRKFGLRSGDVVTSVNGVPMNNPLKALEVMRDLSSATSLTVDIERRGVPQSFSFQIE